MSLVVEQTLPYSNSELQLEDPTRWSRLFPLLRPSTKTVKTSKGHIVVIDLALLTSKTVPIAVVGRTGSFSSKILAESGVFAFVVEGAGKSEIEAEDLYGVLSSEGFGTGNGLVVVRTGNTRNIEFISSIKGLLQVEVGGEVELDHVLSLLSSSNAEVKASLDKTKALLEHFVKSAKTTRSTFREQKSGDVPSVVHAVGIAKFHSAKASIDIDLSHLLGSIPAASDVVYSVHFSDINGLSRLENNILAHEISEYFVKKNLPSYISHSSILDHQALARGWTISLSPIPTKFLSAQPRPSQTLSSSTHDSSSSIKPNNRTSQIQFSDAQVRKIITAGCETVITDEPTITEYDTIVGDGDCGYTLRDGAKQVLHFIQNQDLSQLPQTLSALVDDLEVNMGGTSGALYCIFLSSLAQELWGASTFPDALKGALNHLLKYTTARLGDRTCLDCLIPFVETLKEKADSDAALEQAAKGVETTKKLEAKLGRSSYLDEATTRGVPDPGAYGLLKLLEGMVGAK